MTDSKLKGVIDVIQRHHYLSEKDAGLCMDRILEGGASTDEIKAWLAALNDRGFAADELVGFAQSMRAHAAKVSLPSDAIDICGSGGTGKDRFNVSTAVAFVLASGGVGVAKHGNRGSSKPNGSFDFLEALGVSFELSVDKIPALFKKTNLCFLFARNHHPAMRYVAQARKELGVRTVFNLLGPLSNPAGVQHQIIGTTTLQAAALFAESLQRLGLKRALVMVASDGIDELTTTGPSQIWDVQPGGIRQFEFDPAALGFTAVPTDIEGGLAEDNARLFTALMSAGETAHPISQMVALNAGAAFYCVGKTDTIEAGVALANTLIQDKSAWKTFVAYREMSQLV